jgi:hypothetical protein
MPTRSAAMTAMAVIPKPPLSRPAGALSVLGWIGEWEFMRRFQAQF